MTRQQVLHHHWTDHDSAASIASSSNAQLMDHDSAVKEQVHTN